MKPSRALTWAALALLILIWSTTWAVIRVGLRGVPPFAGVALRFGIASVVLLALAPVFGVKLGRQPNERRIWWINTFLTFTIAERKKTGEKKETAPAPKEAGKKDDEKKDEAKEGKKGKKGFAASSSMDRWFMSAIDRESPGVKEYATTLCPAFA